MSLRLRNTLTGKTEPFYSLKPNEVSIYCCGVTVYDLCHLGHARSYIVWDILRRYLIWKGNKVTFIQNFTDIDDKIIKRAIEENSTMSEVSERNIREFHKDMDALGILRPDRMPKATKCLSEIRSMISTLKEKGAAYSIDGDVYFAVMKHANYGNLSGRDLKEQKLNAGGRVTKSEAERKNHPFDFALWKAIKEGEPGYESPWGTGRPGWHIECSAMVLKELGETIDIHLGGADLIFPHHENEIAQSEAATGKKLARFWLHNGMVNVEGEKMSKSLGNFTTIRALLEKGVSPMTLRLFVLQAHYRKPLDFTDEALKAASNGWKGLNNALCLDLNNKNFSNESNESPQNKYTKDTDLSIHKPYIKIRLKFIEALDDDLNTSAALALLFELARPLKALANQLERNNDKSLSRIELDDFKERWHLLVDLSSVLGLTKELKENISNKTKESIEHEKIELLIKERTIAKKSKDFAKADQIRQELKKQGIELIDKPKGVTDWIRI